MRLPTGALVLTAVAVVACAGLLAVNPAGSEPWREKVDSAAFEATADGSSPVLVLLAEGADLRAAASARDRVRQGDLALAALRRAQASSTLAHDLRRQGVRHREYWVANAVALEADRALLERLARRSDVRRIEYDGAFRAPALESAARTTAVPRGVEWNVSKVGAPALWELGHTGQGLVYANLDTGVDWEHPALKTHYRGFDAAGGAATHDYNWWDAVHGEIDGDGVNACGYDLMVPCDDSAPISHGSHTMGTAIGDDGSGNQIGVAPGAKWIGCRSMESGLGRPSTYLECLQFFLAPTDLKGLNPDPSKRPHVIGNSYACPPDEGCAPESLRVAVDNLRAAGVFMAVSAGNEGRNGCSSVVNPPATYDSAVSVGAVDISDRVAGFSSRGPVTVDGSSRRKPDLVAPGVAVRSAVRSGYATVSGTSMAAPAVGGAVLLLWSALPALRGQVDATEQLLQRTAVPLSALDSCGGDEPGAVPNNTWGYGRIDALAAFRTAEAAARPGLILSDVAVTEGNGSATPVEVRVALSAAAASRVTFSYATRAATALAGKDFRSATGSVRIEPGASAATIEVFVIGDRLTERTETFSVELSDPRGATLTRGRAVITIRDDDRDLTPPRFTSLAPVPASPRANRPVALTALLTERASLSCRAERRAAGAWAAASTRQSSGLATRHRLLLVPGGLPAGEYRVSCTARDAAQNTAAATRPFAVRR